MSVIIRLQNLPWSANALDIRQFFKGLAIPEGGVHIVGGEMGDAFIAFSTDEDARQAMMKDRGKLNEVQIRLLLSSRTEMQKVIEVARHQSLIALQKVGALPATATPIKPAPISAPQPQPPVITSNSLQNILGAKLGAAPSFQTYQQQAGITLIPDIKNDNTENKITSRLESDDSLSPRDRRRSTSRERRRSRSKDRSSRDIRKRRDRSRSRERERDRKSGRQRSSRRSRSRDHSHDRSHNGSQLNRNSKDIDTNLNSRLKPEAMRSSERMNESKDAGSNEAKSSIISPWSIAPTNAYETATGQSSQKSTSVTLFGTGSGLGTNLSNAYTTSPSINDISTPSSRVKANLPIFQNFSTTTSTTNNYSINLLSNPATTTSSDAQKPSFALQNPYTAALRTMSSNSNSQDSTSSSIYGNNAQLSTPVFPGIILENKPTSAATVQPSNISGLAGASPQNAFGQQSVQQSTTQQQQALTQQPITFANTNPYAQMYPNLFAQAAAAGTGIANASRGQNSKQDQKFLQRTGNDSNEFKGFQKNFDKNDDDNDSGKSCSIKISNMCNTTTYSDLRKFFSGLFIPHNGIKMINDREGLRTGVAYIQFSRSSCVTKALIRNNTFLKTKRVLLESVTDEDFQEAEDSYKPHRDYNRFNRNDNYDNSNRGGFDNRFDNRNNTGQGRNDSSNTKQEPLTVLYIEDIPAMATEHDIMKMFSAFSIFDILLLVSAENRREFTAYVKFSREDEAKAALMEQSRHMIGHRKVRVRPSREVDMENAKEKLRLANEQLKKEEAASLQNSEDNENYSSNMDNCEENDEVVEDDITIVENDTDLANTKSVGNSNNNESSYNSEDFNRFKDGPSDPRLRRQKASRFSDNIKNESMPHEGGNNNSPFSQNMAPFQNMPFNGPNVNQPYNTSQFHQSNNMEQNFIILKNCDYNTRINDVAQLLLSANLNLKHIEPLRNNRQMPSGEFIVEFTNPQDASTALNRFNNTMFRKRNLRVRDITPQEIADRIGKPFMNYFPGGGGGRNSGQARGNFDFSGRGVPPPPPFRMNGSMDDRSRFDNMNNRNRGVRMDDNASQNNSSMMRGVGGVGNIGGGGNTGDQNNFNNQDMFLGDESNQDIIDCDNDNQDKSDYEENDEVVSVSSTGQGDDENSAIPEKFNRPGCVLALENVPFKADLKDIIEFFADFDVNPEDIIRRFNDDGSATGDARVAFSTPAKARAAFEAKRQHTIFNRTIFMSAL